MGLGMKTIEIRDNRVILTDGQWTLYNEDWPRIFNRVGFNSASVISF